MQDHPDSIDVVDYLGQTPLILAAKYGFPNVVSYLLGVKAKCDLKDKSHFTAFDWALQRNLPDVVQSFLNTSNWKKVIFLCLLHEVFVIQVDLSLEIIVVTNTSIPFLDNNKVQCFGDNEALIQK